jgi:hypothetical protein
MAVNDQLHAPASLHLGKEPPNILWIGGWVGYRADLDAVAKRKIIINGPARNQTPIVQLVALSL